jgi:hypothetical protein
MRRIPAGPIVLGAIVAALVLVPFAFAFDPDTLVTTGSNPTPFSQNKQNEPALAIDAAHPDVLAAGSNDNLDEEACNAGDDTTCPFTPGIGVSGIYFSFTDGNSWTQPTYTGLSARTCQGAPGPDADCTPSPGLIGTVPKYYENGLQSDGDPALAFGPRRNADGVFTWTAGSRLYYGNLTANIGASKHEQTFKGFEAIYVSRTDNAQAAAAGDKNAWLDPVLVSKQNTTTFSDKDQVWADNASSSPFFGTVYVCWAAFVGQEKGNAAPAPLVVAVSHDGGDTWKQHPVSAAADNSQRSPGDGCTIRTDSHGNAYVFGVGSSSSQGKQAFELMSKSTNGGTSWSPAKPVAGPVTQPGIFDPVLGRPTIDGIAGARSDLAPAPSVDIANGAPTGGDATNRIVMTYVSGTIDAPHVYFTESTNGGDTWSTPRPIETPGDRGLYTAPAISPNGRDVYVVYNAFTTPYRDNTSDPRNMVGVVLHADVSGASTGPFGPLNRVDAGDPRGSSQNDLTAEFLGDYVYAAATRTYGAAVWNDTRDAADCPPLDAWRMSLYDGTSVPKPAPEQNCPATFGNSDIFGGTYPDPTP